MLNAVSIDVGILERSNKVVMIAEQGIGWSDVGSWSAWLEEAQLRTGEQTVVLGDVTTVNCKNVGIIGDQRFIAAIGLEDVVIVDTKDALLVCHKDKAQEVKEVVEQLKRSKRDVLL
jgi:mannose-1-phosphate guanylyltransferase